MPPRLWRRRLHTGRTHQIRVHFQFLGHPLVGDETYGARQNKKLTELTGYEAPRVMLHARELSFVHPRTEKAMSFEAPLPEDFREALKVIAANKRPFPETGNRKPAKCPVGCSTKFVRLPREISA